jgi:cob(I)alamin adenosyltransferase
MKIYTKSGDDGTTGLFNGKRVSKSDIRVDCYGTIDELSSVLGVAVSFEKNTNLTEDLTEVAHKLFRLATDLASPLEPPVKFKIERINEDDIIWLEKRIDSYDEELEPLRNFIMSGGTHSASFLHLARTVARRAERRMMELQINENLGNFVIKFVNRLSDYLFTAARIANKRAGVEDNIMKL